MLKTDQLILEDESGRVSLGGSLSPHRLVTGVTMAVRGSVSVEDLGVFQVKDSLFCHELELDAMNSTPLSPDGL
jgi:hypothetical protein